MAHRAGSYVTRRVSDQFDTYFLHLYHFHSSFCSCLILLSSLKLRMALLQQNMHIEKPKKPKKPKTQPKTSPINKFAADFENNAFPFNKNSVLVYRCHICKYETLDDVAEYLINNGNSSFHCHLENIHRIKILTRQEATIQQDLQNAQKLTDCNSWSHQSNINTHKKKTTFDAGGHISYDSISENRIRTLLLAWLLEDNLPLSTVTTPAFRRFLAGVSPTLSAFVPRSGSTIHKDLEVVVSSKMLKACSFVQRTLSKIHLVFDAWFSPSKTSVLGVIGRYINKQYKLNTHLLSLTEMPESHTGANFAERIFATTEKFKTSERIGFVISNNTSNMNSCIEIMETLFQAAGINWIERYHCIHCFVYIIHLIATAFFFPSNNAPENPNDFEA